MEDAYKKINDILVQLVNEIWELEAKAIITDEFKDITNNFACGFHSPVYFLSHPVRPVM